MKHYCQYHPLSPAIWHCDSCEIYFDKLCMPDGDDKLQLASCPHCKQPLRYLDKKTATTPFWNHKKRFFKLILQPEPLLAICVIALLSIAIQANIVVAIIASAGLCLLATNSAIVIAKNIEQNDSKSPSLNELFTIKEIKERGMLAAILAFIFGTPIAIASFTNVIAAVIFAVPFIYVTPSILLMGLYAPPPRAKREFIRPNWLQIMKRLNISYLTLVSYFVICYLAILIINDIAQQTIPSLLVISLSTALACFLLFFNFACLGYILKRYEGFNAVSDSATIHSKRSVLQKGGRFEADLDIAVKTGNYNQAVRLLEESLKKQSRSDLRRQQLYKLLSEARDITKLVQYAESFLELLVARGQSLQAYELLAAVKAEDSNFQIYDINLINKLCDIFIDMKEYELVTWLAQSTYSSTNTTAHTHRIDTSVERAELYLKVAKMHLSKLQQAKQAYQYLDWIVKHLPESETASAAQRLIEHIKGLAKAKKPR